LKSTLDKIAAKHQDWIRIVKSFGCKDSIAEDIVQEMYLLMHSYLNRGLDINYDDDINHYYIYKQLRGLFVDLHRKEAKIVKVDIDRLADYIDEENVKKEKNICKAMNQMDTLLDKVYWYDRQVFEIISDGTSVAELSKKTGISYYSLYNTYRNVKGLIKDNLEWD